MMKTYLFLFLLFSPLWVCSSCQDDDDKLPGSKPETLLGKWENVCDLHADFFGFLKIGKRWTIYEFTKTGGSITHLDYIIQEDRYKDPDVVAYFTDWSCDGNEIYFLKKKGRSISKWGQPVSELTPDYFILDTIKDGEIYYKVVE